MDSLIIRKILERSYNSDSSVLGNINPMLMADTERQLITGIGQNIALVNLLDDGMQNADESNNKDIIFEYFWGYVYQYIYSNSELRKIYIDGELEEKIEFFNSLLRNKFDSNFSNEKRLLFSFEPNIFIRTRGEGNFKICILNYQNISSLLLAEYINLLTRERPQITILTEEHGLKTNSTGGFYTSVGQDFSYFDIGGNGKVSFKLEKLKNR